MIDLVGPLLGVIIGAIVSFATAWLLERQRWARQRKETLANIQRDAISAALEWIEPMRNAESRASSLVLGAIRGDVEEEQFLEKYPYLLGDLVKRDLPGNQRAVLPDDAYARGHKIVRELDDLRIMGVRYGQEATVMNKPFAGFQEISNKLNNIGNNILELEDDLRAAYLKTFQ